VRVDVPLADASHVRVGQVCEVVVEVLPDRVFRGEVLRLTNEADVQKNTLQAKVRVIDPIPILRPEMLTRVKFLPGITGPARGTTGSDEPMKGERVRVPLSALEEIDGTARVWLVVDRRGDRGVLRAAPVRAIERSDGWVSVAGEIAPGALVALEPGRFRPGQRVVIRGEGGGS
jgi:multidrug efflux pump subunit AcrA (membrane-fusion protein)